MMSDGGEDPRPLRQSAAIWMMRNGTMQIDKVSVTLLGLATVPAFERLVRNAVAVWCQRDVSSRVTSVATTLCYRSCEWSSGNAGGICPKRISPWFETLQKRLDVCESLL